MNRIVPIKDGQVEGIKEKNKEAYIVELDGNLCNTKQNYLDLMWEKFNLPHPDWGHSFDAYNDWILDLAWVVERSIMMIVYHFDHFLMDDPAFKDYLMDYFKQDLLPYWEKDVMKHVVGGKPRKFMIYLVE